MPDHIIAGDVVNDANPLPASLTATNITALQTALNELSIDLDADTLAALAVALANLGVDLSTSDINQLATAIRAPYTLVVCGELAGSVAAAQGPNVACAYVVVKALVSNVGNVYVGVGNTITKPDGATDTTTGIELCPGDVHLFEVSNLNLLWRICDNAGDDLTYFAHVS